MSYAVASGLGLLRESPVFYMQYYLDGKKVRENCHTEKESEARRMLNARLGLVATGAPLLPRADKVTYEQARADLLAYYATAGERDVIEATRRLKHLDPYFQGRRLVRIGPDDCTGYAAARRKAGAANGTVNRELSVLGRLLSLAVENKKLVVRALIRKLAEAKPRAGFFERDQYEAVRRHLPVDIQVAIAIMHTYGWRKMEVLTLERRQLDLVAGRLTLDPGTTKNEDGRVGGSTSPRN